MKVLYVVGVGRSGSTLLERMLGAVPGFHNAGELNALFSRVSVQDQRCGCGRSFSTCPFWESVGQHGLDRWDSRLVHRLAELQPRLIRQRYIPRLLAPRLAPPSFRRELDEYVDAYRRVYEAVAEVSGAEVLVDASKSAAQLFALRHIGDLDLRVINLVRDSRGVAHSWSKADVAMPQIRGREALMRTYAPRDLALMWSALQLESAYLCAAAGHGARVRYEDLIADPRRTLEQALLSVGLPPQPGWLDHVDDRSVTLQSSHGLAGSRFRFKSGRIELKLDDDWRAHMSTDSRRVVTALTLPQLLSYGYVRPSSKVAA